MSDRRMDSLPERPLRDEELRSLLSMGNVVEVWVPESRPKNIATGGGAIQHSGDIMKVWLELTDRYLALQYESPEHGDGLAWYRSEPTSKENDDIVEMIEMTLKQYRPLSETVNAE